MEIVLNISQISQSLQYESLQMRPFFFLLSLSLCIFTDLVAQRGEKLELLIDKTENLVDSVSLNLFLLLSVPLVFYCMKFGIWQCTIFKSFDSILVSYLSSNVVTGVTFSLHCI